MQNVLAKVCANFCKGGGARLNHFASNKVSINHGDTKSHKATAHFGFTATYTASKPND
jgi:hypothetical protein